MLINLKNNLNLYYHYYEKTNVVCGNRNVILRNDSSCSDFKIRAYRFRSLDSVNAATAEYQSKLQSYQSKADSLPDAIRATKEKELTDLGQRIQDFQQTAQESIQSKKQEIYGPILKKAEDAIKEIAKEKSYSYIFDTSLGSVIFAQEGDNIMPLVKAKLGIK